MGQFFHAPHRKRFSLRRALVVLDVEPNRQIVALGILEALMRYTHSARHVSKERVNDGVFAAPLDAQRNAYRDRKRSANDRRTEDAMSRERQSHRAAGQYLSLEFIFGNAFQEAVT